ncbi:MAG: hypothetical protein WBD95_09290, partial [Xanthobacteraceae bacterium]
MSLREPTKPRCGQAAPHRRHRVVDQALSEHRAAEGPTDERCHPRSSQCREPTKYRLSTLPEGVAFHRLVEIAKLRWRIERDYQERSGC